MAEQEQNRNEPATPFKLREAKKRGQVAKSLEANSFLIVAGLLAVVYIWGERMIVQQLNVDRILFNQAHLMSFEITSLMLLFKTVLFATLLAFSPLILVLLVLSIAGNLFQTGPVFTFFPLKPDIQRINPVAGFKRIFSMKLLFEALKSAIKVALFVAIVYYAMIAFMPTLFSLVQVDPHAYSRVVLDLISTLVFKLNVAILLIALLDLIYTRKEFAKKMRMSQREVKEEIKRREGDPHVRARIRELRKEAAKRSRSLQRVPDADVLITNPTHVAVALLYKRGSMLAPEVIAKGAGELAQTMKKMARTHRVPVIENKSLARRLFRKAGINSAVPESLFTDVAKILVAAYAASGKHALVGARP